MGKPIKKLKKILFIMGITGAVYGSFRYLLPLVIPFLFSWGLALLLRPSSRWLANRLRFRLRGREFGIPIGAIGVVQLLVLSLILLALVCVGGRRLCLEACLLASRIPGWIAQLDHWLTAVCHDMESFFCMRSNRLVYLMREMLRGLMESTRQAAMPFLMANSVVAVRLGVESVVFLVLVTVGTGMALQEMEQWKARCERSQFQREYALIARRLSLVFHAYLKTQGGIMLLTAVICTAGLWLLGNPYYILLGVGIGLLDALPVFGTGTVLIPWALVYLFGRRFVPAVVLLLLYVICYFLRQILEAKMMGSRVGLSPLETLIAMYVGLRLFGIPGFLLGSIGLLLIEDLVEACTESND
ncbi:MAG: AI-2E family transporter [Lachnospiraceae bacterium]|nr:AI-2E family transporter [Lachnospiraceae bacterium]